MTTQSDTYIVSALQQLGFSKPEALVYKACFARGEVTIMELARLTSIKRTTIYGIAEGLVKKGQLRFVQKGSHRVYSAEDPKKLSLLIEQTKASLDRKMAFLDSILPSLSMQYSQVPNKPLVSYYQGQKEVQKIFEDYLQSGTKEILFVGGAAAIEQALGPKYLKDNIKRRINLGIVARGIRTYETEVEEPEYNPGKKYLRKLRMAPKGFMCPTYIGIYQNKVFFISSIIESYGVLVESKDLATTMRSWFEVLWKASKSKLIL